MTTSEQNAILKLEEYGIDVEQQAKILMAALVGGVAWIKVDLSKYAETGVPTATVLTPEEVQADMWGWDKENNGD